MKYYIISDTHFGHRNIVDFCGRPPTFGDLLCNGLEKCPKGSILIHLGDHIFGDIVYWQDRFAYVTKHFAKTYLVMGNHDKMAKTRYLESFDCVCDSIQLNVFGREVLFSHKPQEIHNSRIVNIHGHWHNLPEERIQKYEPELLALRTNHHFLVSMENNNYKPYNLEKILGRIK